MQTRVFPFLTFIFLLIFFGILGCGQNKPASDPLQITEAFPTPQANDGETGKQTTLAPAHEKNEDDPFGAEFTPSRQFEGRWKIASIHSKRRDSAIYGLMDLIKTKADIFLKVTHPDPTESQVSLEIHFPKESPTCIVHLELDSSFCCFNMLRLTLREKLSKNNLLTHSPLENPIGCTQGSLGKSSPELADEVLSGFLEPQKRETPRTLIYHFNQSRSLARIRLQNPAPPNKRAQIPESELKTEIYLIQSN